MLSTPEDLSWSPAPLPSPSPSPSTRPQPEGSRDLPPQKVTSLSLFESIVTTYPPILESLLAQIPTASLLHLYHTSRHLRSFLRDYPLAWKAVSFRLPQPTLLLGSPGTETPDARERQSKQYALDALLIQVVVPFGTRLTSLDLCNTAVSGVALTSRVLQPRLATLQHLSVRGCKNVSIKYHIVPFLEPYSQRRNPWAERGHLALRSLYAYRCRHHRRRPYLPSSLLRRDSDSEPTHQLIEICHELSIWTDTAWCPTPGGRCYRRRDYHANRVAAGTAEVWVPFDRLWRSCNRIGPAEDRTESRKPDGRLWEDAETGHDGEALGTQGGPFQGEGKGVPAHLRRSHRTFVENLKCDQCGDAISERCQQCSIRMHCMGCRKTLCASCAFTRPLPRKRAKTSHSTSLAFGASNTTPLDSMSTPSSSQHHIRHSPGTKKNRFWWAPGVTRSPNLMNENVAEEDSSESDDAAANNGSTSMTSISAPPKLKMNWCCLEPIFSGSGDIAILGHGLGRDGAERIRAAPLPKGKGYEDPDFTSLLTSPELLRKMKNQPLYNHVLGDDVDILPHLQREILDLQAESCPRSLCQDCYLAFRWKISCRACKRPICKEHDLRGLKVRKCGYRDLNIEREYVLSFQPAVSNLEIPAFGASELRPLPSVPPCSPPSDLPVPQPSSLAEADNTADVFGTPLERSSASCSSDRKPVQASDPEHPGRTMSNTPDSTAGTTARAAQVENSKLFHASRAPDMSTSVFSDRFASTSTLGPGIPRQRALSLSGLQPRPSLWSWPDSSRPSQRDHLPLPCHPRHPVQWEGCGAYFCQQVRPITDGRFRCTATVKECAECGVYVCEFCLADTARCPCTYCKQTFHCPHCTLKPSVQAQCRREEEQRAQIAVMLAEKKRQEREVEFLKHADELAEGVQEFFAGLSAEDEAGLEYSAEDETLIAEVLAAAEESSFI
ncbi:hypothetical protein W97_08441 [Coniosporium apollinis CBS 100218]|uniref:Uncharacterized protein n=1 Tax=Coniosporium apollinis (strain CBS 100218) TaxID=1168221 RepID=R7Z5T2_CONA1|nr:uncharacterized protein W97_08441 [Coniosporium apollinis CBS 100218]EON69281.1 hypothetical protein W97_08441 [Coniosporium apollinis CBS 100218]